MSYPEIGAMLGGRHHSTVIHSCQRIEGALAVDGVLKWDLLQIAQTLAERQQIRLVLPSEMKLLEPPTGIEPAASPIPTERSTT